MLRDGGEVYCYGGEAGKFDFKQQKYQNGVLPNRNEDVLNLNEAVPNRNEAVPNRNEALPNRNEALPNRDEAGQSCAEAQIFRPKSLFWSNQQRH